MTWCWSIRTRSGTSFDSGPRSQREFGFRWFGFNYVHSCIWELPCLSTSLTSLQDHRETFCCTHLSPLAPYHTLYDIVAFSHVTSTDGQGQTAQINWREGGWSSLVLFLPLRFYLHFSISQCPKTALGRETIKSLMESRPWIFWLFTQPHLIYCHSPTCPGV